MEQQKGSNSSKFSSSRSNSPRRNSNSSNAPKLPDIPEATPGPNAFAQHAVRMDRHRLESNAFYQQEVQMQMRLGTPPALLQHPALRQRAGSDPPTPMQQELQDQRQQQSRDSQVTTMSPFINAGRMHSPPLKLVPELVEGSAWPTRRGFIEERREAYMHETSGSDTERTPVYQYTPKVACEEFGKSMTSSSFRGRTGLMDQNRSPRKGLLGKLLGQPRAIVSQSQSNFSSYEVRDAESVMPPKAQAVLGNISPNRTSLVRSPSKKKGLFSRRTTEGGDNDRLKVSMFRKSAEAEPAPLTAVSLTKTSLSDPTPKSTQAEFLTTDHHQIGKRSISQTLSDREHDVEKANEMKKSTVGRSQSLQYMDRTIPPTPPKKNTPPNEKLVKPVDKRTHLQDTLSTTPQREPVGVFSSGERLSPTKYGSYGQKETPRIVHQPSIYSMHASVFPNLTDSITFEEMKARVEGLGLEGLSKLPEHMICRPELFYSPSIYSEYKSSPRPGTLGQPAAESNPDHFASMPSTATSICSPSMHTKNSSSSDATMTVCYPDLGRDPSIASFDVSSLRYHNDDMKRAKSLDRGARMQSPDEETICHGYTHSPEHSDNAGMNADAGLFSRSHVAAQCSPTSFKHQSAMPSPLQYLPATVYTPPRKATPSRKEKFEHEECLVHGDAKASPSQRAIVSHPTGSSTPSMTLFDNMPSLPASTSTKPPVIPPRRQPARHTEDVDPSKPSVEPIKSPSPSPFDKLDEVLRMLNHVQAQTEEVKAMRAELQSTSARLEERLSVVEYGQSLDSSSSRPSSAVSSNKATAVNAHERDIEKTVAIQPEPNGDARDDLHVDHYYNPAAMPQPPNMMHSLIDLIGSFAERLESLENKLGCKTG